MYQSIVLMYQSIVLCDDTAVFARARGEWWSRCASDGAKSPSLSADGGAAACVRAVTAQSLPGRGHRALADDPPQQIENLTGNGTRAVATAIERRCVGA